MFKNETTYTKEEARESHIVILKYRKGMIFIKLLMAFQIVLIVGLIIFEYMYNAIYYNTFFLIGAPIFEFIFIKLMNELKLKLERKRIQAVYHGKDPVLICEIADQIITHNVNTGENIVFEYCYVDKMVESKNLIILKIKGNIIITLKKNGFTQGSWSECKEFIRQKCKECKNKNNKLF